MPESTASPPTEQGRDLDPRKRRAIAVLAIYRRRFNARHGRDEKDRRWHFEPCNRDGIIALLALDWPAKQIRSRAPWLTADLIDALAREALTIRADGEGIGALIRYSNAERDEFKITALWPFDKPRDQIEEEQAMRKKARDREQALQRRRDVKVPTIAVRRLALLRVLMHWPEPPMARSLLVDRAQRLRSRLFTGSDDSVKRCVLRHLDWLIKHKLVRYRRGPASKHGPMRYVEIANHKAVAEIINGVRSVAAADRRELEKSESECQDPATQKCHRGTGAHNESEIVDAEHALAGKNGASPSPIYTERRGVAVTSMTTERPAIGTPMLIINGDDAHVRTLH